MAEDASAGVVFKIRAVATQFGWLETCIPVVAAQAGTDVETPFVRRRVPAAFFALLVLKGFARGT